MIYYDCYVSDEAKHRLLNMFIILKNASDQDNWTDAVYRAACSDLRADNLIVYKSFHQNQLINGNYYSHITIGIPGKFTFPEQPELTSTRDEFVALPSEMEAALIEEAQSFVAIPGYTTFHLYAELNAENRLNYWFSKISIPKDKHVKIININYINSPDVNKTKSLSAAPSEMFQGYDSISGAGLLTAVIGKTIRRGGYSSVDYSVVSSISDLYEKLDVSASLSVGFGGFGNASAKAKFVEELKLTEESLSILVRATQISDVYTTNNYQVEDGLAPTTPEEIPAFVSRYGDSFISELTLGGEYYAVYSFYSQSRDQKKNIEAQLKVNGIGSFGKVDVDFQSKLDRVVSAVNTSTVFKQNITGIENPKLPEPDHLVQYALNFLTLSVNAPAVIAYQTTGYERAPGMKGDLFQPVNRNRRYFAEKSDYSVALGQVTELLNKLELVREVYRFYEYKVDEKVDVVFSAAKRDKATLCGQLYQYEETPSSSFQLPQLPSLAYGIPALNVKVSTSDAKGRTGGGAFDDVDNNTYVEQMSRITKIDIHAGTVIDRIDITYQPEGKNPYTPMHGGGGGSGYSPLQLRKGVFIESISGRSGEGVDALTIETTDGQYLEAGGGGGRPFKLQSPSETAKCIGFKGRSGARLDQIQAIYIDFRKAIWNEG